MNWGNKKTLKLEKKDPNSLLLPVPSTSLTSSSDSLNALYINNLVFMDDSMLISSSKDGMEHMLLITEKFYHLNNTSANYKKYVLATNAIASTHLFSFWMYAKLTPQQVVKYQMQVAHLSDAECSTTTSSVRVLVKHKAKLSHSTPNAILHLSQALGLINLFCHQQHCTHLISWSAFYSKLSEKRGNAHTPKWYKDLCSNVTIPGQNYLLKEQFNSSPCVSTGRYKKIGLFAYENTTISPLLLAEAILVSSPIVTTPDSSYIFYTDGSLINLGAHDVSMGWSWPSSSRTEAAAIYAALTVSPSNSVVSIYTDSQTFIHGLKQCSLSTYSNSRLYYKTNNFELWAIIQQLIIDKSSRLTPIFIGQLCHLFKQYHQAFFMKNLLDLSHFRFLALLTDSSQYMVNWALTWHTLMYQSNYDDSFTLENTSRHFMMKFQLFLKDLPTLKILKWLRPDLYIDIFTCRSCEDHLKDFMHLFMCKRRCFHMQQIMTSYLHHLIIKLTEAGELANHDPSAHIKTITSFAYILRSSAMNAIAAIHNNFINKLIWNQHSYDKGLWENVINISSKLKNFSRPSGLPKSSYLPHSSLPLLTHVDLKPIG
ncbi:hypothetical protein RhiirC2_795586 [Rhizophagus irregularis]|uniref:Uncharacterized protein n=1 Tax=Rhizophagus irregularis TaxID=588596 RepID=A0A2N1MB98_9GLOM|nr:hypothetical protein RhiirC2_795586 [Rhizophagus irregularis]